MNDIVAVIMAGGAGTRFWPASRRARPKQLLSLVGGEPLLEATLRRVEPLCGPEALLVATGAHLVEPTLSLVPRLRREQLLVEPVARNTAPCIGWAAATVARTNPEAVVMALPADQHIADTERFLQTAQAAIASARSGVITTIGIRPTRPEQGYGYIEADPSDEPAWPVRRFVEKPDRARAEAFLAAGNFFWNAGMFFFRACDMLAAIRAHLPELADRLADLDAAAARNEEDRALAELFPRMPAVSIDTGVMEKVSPLAVVPGDFDWSDVGSWLAASELSPKDAEGNGAPPSAVLIDSRDNHVVDATTDGKKRVVALVGVRDLVVVETDDALLVVHRSEAQRVREVVDRLVARGDGDLT